MKEPFFAHLLSSVIRNGSKKIPTAAVGVREGVGFRVGGTRLDIRPNGRR